MTPLFWATVRGIARRENMQEKLGVSTLPLVSAIPRLMFQVDSSELTPEQVTFLVAHYGVNIPADEWTISYRPPEPSGEKGGAV